MKRAVITGAATGIGYAIARRLAALGYEIIIIGRSAEKLETAARQLGAGGAKGKVIPLVIDVKDSKSLVDALGDMGPFDAMVASAGICTQAALDDPDADEVWDEVLSVNLNGVWNTFKAVIPHMNTDGRAVVISSGLGKLGRPGYSAYTASKHAVLGLVKCLSMELAGKRITVNAVCPGWVNTEMAGRDLVRTATSIGQSVEDVKKAALDNIPLERFVEADEVAALVLWLLSKDAAAVTGQAYNMSCGEFFA